MAVPVATAHSSVLHTVKRVCLHAMPIGLQANGLRPSLSRLRCWPKLWIVAFYGGFAMLCRRLRASSMQRAHVC